MSAAMIHLLCPACGQAFLTRVQHALSVQSCPHCAFTGTSDHFHSAGLPQTASLDMKRRELVRRPSVAAVAAANPNAWEVRTYAPIVPAPFSGTVPPPPAPPQPYHRHEVPQEPQWETMQAFSAQALPVVPQIDPLQQPSAPPYSAEANEPGMPRWSPMKAPGGRKLTQWASLDIAPASTPESADYFVPKPKSKITSVFIVVVVVVVTGVVGTLWLDKKNAARSTASMRASADAEPVIAKALPVAEPEPTITIPQESLMTAEATVKRTETLLHQLMEATTSEARLACLANSKPLKDQVDDFFKKIAGPIKIGLVRPLPATAKPLPSQVPVPMCAMEATMPEGKVKGLVRLVTDLDGTVKLDWLSLHDSLLKRLSHYASAPRKEPEWIMIGLRRNFGFAESAEVRDSHHAFDVQGLGDGSDHTLAFASKDQPIGRALDSTLGWNQLYMMRALVHWNPVGDRLRMTIIDADLAPPITASR